MRPSLALTAALLGCAAMALPSHAQATISPDCSAHLVAGAVTTNSCATQGPPPVECNGCGVRRVVDIAAVTGSLDAFLDCDGWQHATAHVVAPAHDDSIGLWGGQSCTLTLVATSDGTSAVATSTASYVFVTNAR